MAWLDEVYNILEKSKKPVPFVKIWEKIKKTYKLSDDKVGGLFSDMSFDIRFINLKNNVWDLSSRHTYDEIHWEGGYDLSEEESEEFEVDGGDYDDEEEYDDSGSYGTKNISQAIEDYDVSEENSKYEDED